jgi:methyl-accepting chemotaxis protein
MRSLRAKFVVITGLLLATALGSAAVGLWSNGALTESIAQNLLLARAMHNQDSADMMHDALRGDVYRALHAARAQATLRSSIEQDLKEHLDQLRLNVADNAALPLPAALRETLKQVEQPLSAYAKSATNIVELAFESTMEGEQHLPEFVKSFEALEEVMEAVSSQIQESAEQVKVAAERLAQLTAIMNWITGIVSVVIALGLCLYLLRGVVRPIARMTHTMNTLAAGNLDVQVPSRSRRDEIGHMARAVEVFRDNAREMAALRDAQEQTREASERRRRADLLALADQVEASLKEVAAAVSTAAQETAGAAETVSHSVQVTNEQASAVAAAAQQASANVQTVATATEELSASFGEVAAQVARAAAVARRATNTAERTNGTVEELTASAQRIEEVVQLISTVAAQTNLLALNATIEAARAGEAGRGFAVVASEVKELANQTAKATETIAAQINGMQATTGHAVSAIREISETVRDIDGISAAIAAAVEEQQAAAHEIARNVQQASQGTQEVSQNIEGVGRAAMSTSSAASSSLAASKLLNGQAATLVTSLDEFLMQMRAA